MKKLDVIWKEIQNSLEILGANQKSGKCIISSPLNHITLQYYIIHYYTLWLKITSSYLQSDDENGLLAELLNATKSDGNVVLDVKVRQTFRLLNSYEMYQFIVEGVFMVTVGCVGLCFNLMAFVGYLRKKCHRTFHRKHCDRLSKY